MTIPCAIYTRKSSEEGLEQGFNSLDAQREACEAFILSQKTQGWKLVDCYGDGGFSGGNVERPGLQRLMADIAKRRVLVIVVYKVDRLTRSLADFAKLVELFDANGVSFVSVTQQFNTTSSMGRLTLNVLLSFAQFEREVTGERIRDKIAASKRKGMWMGGFAPLGYVPHERSLTVDEPQAERVREIFRLYLQLGCVRKLKVELDAKGWQTPHRIGRRPGGGRAFTRGHLYRLLANPIYVGRISHKGQIYPGQHPAIIGEAQWDAVQTMLAENAQGNSVRIDAAEPSLLAGLLVDDQQRPFQPTHAKKGSKRYRYYFRPRGEGDQDPALWLPAPEVEGVVLQEVGRFLRNEHQLLGLMPDVGARKVQRLTVEAAGKANVLSGGSASARVRLLKEIVGQVVISPRAIEIMVRKQALGMHEQDASSPATHSIEAQVQLKRCGSGMRMIVRGASAKASAPDPRLIALLAKANRWFQALRTGKSESIRALAEEHGVESSDVTQTIYLAFLAPDIVRAITRGEQPAGLGIRRIMSLMPPSLDWAAQRRALGFAS